MSEVQVNSENSQVYSVEMLNIQIKQLLEGQMGVVWVRGELSNFKAHTSGHYYFSLKDSKSQVSAVMFRGHNSRLKFKPTDGLEVIVRGRLSVYEPRGNYQIICDLMDPVGAGALQKAFEQLKQKLKMEGLFELSRKKAIPLYPKNVAVVTSPTGAAIRDILNVLSRRAKNVSVTIVPTVVQGESAAPQIVEALKKAILLPLVDVIILGRGGGSIEDMWCFNDETLARTIAGSPIPIISAVGHEIDFTISDFVADLRAPTPSAAAELVAKSSHEIALKISSLDRLLGMAFEKRIRSISDRLIGLSRRLTDPQRKLQDLRLKNDDLVDRLNFSVNRLFEKFTHRLALLNQSLKSPEILIQEKRKDVIFFRLQLHTLQSHKLDNIKSQLSASMSLLDSLSPLKVVERGFAIVKTTQSISKSRLIKKIDQVHVGDVIQVQLHQGEFTARIETVLNY